MPLNAHIINAVLRRDSKDSTYKFALLRGLVQLVTEQFAHHRLVENPLFNGTDSVVGADRIPLRGHPVAYRYPLGILVWYWLQYYYPIFAHDQFVPQKNGESPDMQPGVTLAIRRPFIELVKYYSTTGGLAQLRYDLLKDDVPSDISNSVAILLRKLSETIVKMPIYYMGSSVFGEPNSLVFAERGRIRGLSYGSLLDEAGWVYIHPQLHEIINSLGGLLVGDDSIVSGWAAFTALVSRRTDGAMSLSQAEVLSLLQANPMGDRDVLLAKRVLDRHAQKCVWSGRTSYPMHIDHMLPYSVTKNNGLWNLAPVLASVNQRKSDKIPTSELISASESRILDVWSQFESEYDNLFWQEVYEGLGVSRNDGRSVAITSLKRRSDYLVNTRGFEGFYI